MKKKRNNAFLTLIFLSLFFVLSCGEQNALEKIRQTGVVTVLTRNNAHCYYTYRDNPWGFEYDLARSFSDHLGVELNVITPRWENLTEVLNSGK